MIVLHLRYVSEKAVFIPLSSVVSFTTDSVNGTVISTINGASYFVATSVDEILAQIPEPK